MSLFECPECGSQVSDKAEACPKCGYPIQQGAIHSDSDDSLAATPENSQGDKPVNKRKPRAWLYIAGAVLLAGCIFGALYSTHIICFHNWQDANCIQPKKCHICKRTVGEKNPDSHWWEPASCSKPKHCRNCGKKVGKKDPKAHRWVNASCVEPKHCTECGKTDGKKNPDNHALEDHEGGGKICWKCGATFGVEEDAEQSKAGGDGDAGEDKAAQDEKANKADSVSEKDKASGAGGESASDSDAKGDSQGKTEFKVEWVDGAPGQFGSNGSTAIPGEAKIVKSKSGEYVLTIDFTYTNESENAQNFINDMYCGVDPYQGGVELDTPGITSEAGSWNYSDAFTSIKQGATIETQLAWVLRDTESPIEIEFGMNSDYKPAFTKTLTIS